MIVKAIFDEVSLTDPAAGNEKTLNDCLIRFVDYISKDYNGLTKTIAELVGGVDVKVITTGFANDLTTFRGKDDVLTLMIHLGYLAYDSDKKTVHIPNEEIKQEFHQSIREVKHQETLSRLAESHRLFDLFHIFLINDIQAF